MFVNVKCVRHAYYCLPSSHSSTTSHFTRGTWVDVFA